MIRLGPTMRSKLAVCFIEVVVARGQHIRHRILALLLHLLRVLLFRHVLALDGLRRRREFFEQFLRRHFQRRIFFELFIQSRIVNRIGIELLLDPFLKTHLPYFFHLSGTQSMCRASRFNCVVDGFVLGEIGDGERKRPLNLVSGFASVFSLGFA